MKSSNILKITFLVLTLCLAPISCKGFLNKRVLQQTCSNCDSCYNGVCHDCRENYEEVNGKCVYENDDHDDEYSSGEEKNEYKTQQSSGNYMESSSNDRDSSYESKEYETSSSSSNEYGRTNDPYYDSDSSYDYGSSDS